jgi:hypothetical protein
MGPITEQRQVPGPVVYGYLLLTAACQARHIALGRALAEYCEQHELMLAALFTDADDDTVEAPGFTRLLDVLAREPSYGVVIPTRAHLGHGQAAESRRSVIAGTGRRLMLIREKSSTDRAKASL